MKKLLLAFFFLLPFLTFCQEENIEKKRIQQLSTKLDSIRSLISGLNQNIDFNVSNIELPVFIRSIGKTRKINLSVKPELENIVLTHNFSNASVKDILIYLCREYKLTFDITGNIISLKKYTPSKKEKVYSKKEIFVKYDPKNDLLSFDLQKDTISIAFKKITNTTGKNIVFSPELGNRKISGYIKNKSFESAMDKLAFSNDLIVTKTKDNYYLFESNISPKGQNVNNHQRSRPRRKYRNSNFFFKIKDFENQLLEVDFENTPISSIIKDIGHELNINMFTNASLENMGNASVKANNISFNNLLTKILENTSFTYKKSKEIYYFGKEEQASSKNSVIIPLMHRSIEIMNQQINNNQTNTYSYNKEKSFNNSDNIDTRNHQVFDSYQSKSEALVNILPRDIIKSLEIKTDIEHNTFIVSGDAQKIKKFKEFITKIDKPVPVILIEVMILEVTKSATISSGFDWVLGDKEIKDKGNVFPSTNLTLGAKTINKIIGGINDFGTFNIGKVVPNFFAKIKFMEENGNLKIRSTPKLSTLNGHQATLSNGERSYYKIERTDVIGSQNPQTVKTNNYVPIDANLTIGIRPIVSGDEQITLSINVLQSSFNGKQIDKNAPPGMNSRKFTSTIRVRDQDVIILGGLEEKLKNDSGSGVPLLARIPIIKWFFSNKSRTDSKSKLSVLIKPTIIK